MKLIKLIFAISLSFLCLFSNLQAQNYNTLSETVSSGGGVCTGSNYSNFGIMGETFVNNSVEGGGFNASLGFLYAVDSIPDGIEELFYYADIKVYPNPVKDILYIESSIQIGRVEIFNLFGELELVTNNKSVIKTNSLAASIYFVCLYNTNGKLLRHFKLSKI